MAQRKRRPRRAVAPDDRVRVAKQAITPGELEDGGELYPARGLPGGSGILPEEERDKPRLTVVEAEDNLPSDGLIVSPRAMARAVLDGGKTLIVKTRPFKLAGNESLVISEREALGTVKLGDMFDIKDLEEFAALEDQHGISEELREEWAEAQEGWKSPPYYAWPVEGKIKFKTPLKTNIGAGPQVVARDVEIVKVELGWTVEKQIRADAECLFFFARLPKALGEKLISLSKEIAEDAGVKAEEADHATVLYLKSAKGAISEVLAADAVRAAQKALASVPPLEAALQGWGYFDDAKKDGKAHTALVALLDCPGLAEAHVALKGAMEGLGLPVEKQTHGYVPHATVAYLDAGDRVDNLPTLGAKFRIGELELMHTKAHVLKLTAKVKKSKALELAPDTDPADLSNRDLLQAHWRLHLLFRDEKARTAARFSTEDVTNLHALVVDELFGRGRKHPAPPDEGLDDVSADFERYVEEQPDWTEVPEKRVEKQELAPINPSGVERGDEITLGEVLPYFKSFKTKKPYVYLVGGLANRGATKGDIDILVKDTEELPEDFRHVLHFRLGRMLPPELAERLEIHYDNFHGPFTKFVELYDLTFERINPENEVKEMREDMVVVEKVGPFKRWGGSARYATRLASNLPIHKRYVEPFAGAASLLFAKEPAEEEILSDLDGEIVHAFKMIKGADEDLIKHLEKKDRVVNEAKFREFAKSIPSGPIDRLHRFLYVGSRNGPPPTDRIGKVAYDPARLVRFRDRLKNVKIVHADYREMLKKYDDEETLFFLDPPYPGEWAKDKDDIGDERSKAELDLDEFVDLVKKLKGKWVVVLGDSEEQKKAIKETGGKTFSYELQESTGRGTKIARRYFATNAEKLSKQASRVASAERIAEAERAEKSDKLTLGEFFYQPKPTRAAVVEELMTIDSLLRLYREHAEAWLPTHVQKKFDGANHQIHKDGDKVVIFSEDGDDNTDRLPGLVAEIKALKTDKLVLPAEIERWKGRQHFPREAAAGYLNAKTPPDDSEMVANVYDVLYFGDEGDVHKWPTYKRLELLGRLGAKQSTMGVPDLKHRINAAPGTKAHDLEELERAVRRIRELPGSEGIVAKQADAPYRLAAVTEDDWVKLHNTSLVRGIVIGRTKTKGGVWVYHYGVLPGRRDPVETVEVDGKKVSPVGDTFGTKLDLDTGDGILVEAETVNVIRDPKGERMTVWVPRPIKLWPGKPDTVDSAAARARRNLILQVKEIDEEGEITYLPTRPVEKQEDPYMEIPPEEKAPYRYTVSQHFRGKSVHSDFRIAFRPGKLLIGWTLLTGIADAIKVPVVTLAQARQLGRTRMDEISKVDWTTGEWAKRPKRGAKEPVRISVQATRKAPEPAAWLDVEGKTKEPQEGKPPPVGGTRHFPGVFQIVDRGDIEFGAQKPWLHEYFPSGRALNYRLFFRQLRLKADGTEELPDNLKGEVLEKVILPPSEEAELPGPVWLCIRPDDQTPYVLDIDAVKKGWMPPLGVSALPKAIRKQVPAEHRYWEQRTNAKAKQVRDALHAAIKAKEVELDFEAPYKRKAEKASMLDAKFVLQEQTWRGPIQIRVGPSRTLWYLRLDVGRPELIVVEMYLNPLDNDRLAVRVIDDPHKESMRFEGDIKPSHYLNPTKATPSRIEILDSGDASVLAASDKFLKVQVKGKKFKGLFEAKRSDGDWLWAPSQAAPKTKSDAEEWQVSYEVPILKVDKAKREITGIVLEPEERDAQGEIIDEEVIAKAAHRFLARFNRETEMGLMHKMFGDIGVELYESWTTKVKMELGGEKIKKGSWLMCVHVLNDGVWKKVQDGEIAGFSIGGTAAMV